MAQQPTSPVTGILEESSVFIDFGEHEGKSILEVACDEPEYYDFLIQTKEKGGCNIRRQKDKTFRLFVNLQ